MRYYSFAVMDEAGADIFRIYGGWQQSTNQTNCLGVNIAFETQIFSQNFSQTIGYVRLDNSFTLDDYMKLLTYKGKPMELYAGFSDNATFLKQMGYPTVQNKLIIRGVIQNVVADFSKMTKSVYFYFVPQSTITRNHDPYSQNKRFALVLNTGDNIKEKLYELLDSNNLIDAVSDAPWELRWLTTVSSTEWIDNLKWTQGGIVLEADTFRAFWGRLCELGFIEEASDGSMRLYHIASHIDATNRLWLRRNDEPVDPSSTSIIYPQEVIAQPNLTNLAGGLNLTIRLRGDLNMNTIVTLSAVKIQTGSLATNSGTGMSLNTPGIYAGTLYGGTYRINSINHMGEYANGSPESWSTQLELMPYGSWKADLAGA